MIESLIAREVDALDLAPVPRVRNRCVSEMGWQETHEWPHFADLRPLSSPWTSTTEAHTEIPATVNVSCMSSTVFYVLPADWADVDAWLESFLEDSMESSLQIVFNIHNESL